MERRNLIIVAAAVLIGLLAVYLANAWFTGVQQKQDKIAATQKVVRIAVANRDMAFGDPLTGDNVRLASWPANSVPEGAFREGEAQKLTTAGDVAIRPIARGEPILLSRISERAVLSANIPQDMRAVTVSVDDVSGVAGFVTPGDVVDILLTRQVPGDSNGDSKMTSTIMENVPVLAMDRRADEKNTDPTRSRTATLQVTPQGAQMLALATQVGRLSLALRNVQDQFVGRQTTVTTRDLGGPYFIRARRAESPRAAVPALASALPAAVSAAAPRRYVGPNMTVVRGTEESVHEVQRYGF